MDGWITIGTKINTSQAEKDLAKLEKALEKVIEQKEEALEARDQLQIEFETTGSEEIKNLIDEINQRLNVLNGQEAQIRKGIEKTKNSLASSGIKEGIKNISSETSKLLSKIAKWGLALVGLRSIYSLLSSSASLLSSENEQIGANIEYIRWTIATALQPIIEYIIKLVITLLQYVNYLANAWFGVNLFANASANSFKKSKDNVKGVNQEAKKLQKTLAGFDEMNIIQEDGSVSRGGGGGGISTPLPETDLSKLLTDAEVPGWLVWIKENGDLIASIIGAIGGALIGWKVGTFLSNIGLLGNGLKDFKTLLIGLGIGLIAKGIFDAFNDWGDLTKVIGDIGTAVEGLGFILVGINPTAWWSWAILGVGFLMDLVGWLFDTKSDVEKLKEAQDKLNESQQKYLDASKTQLNAYKNVEKAEKQLTETAKKWNISEEDVRKTGRNLQDEISTRKRKISDLTDKEKEIYEAYLNDADAQNGLVEASKKVKEARQQEIVDDLKVKQINAQMKGSYEEYGDAIITAFTEGAISTEEAGQRMYDALQHMSNDSASTFATKIPGDLKQTIKQFDNMFGTQHAQQIEANMNIISGAVIGATSKMKTNAQQNLKGIETSINNTLNVNNYKNKANRLVSLFDGIKTAIAPKLNITVQGVNKTFGFAKGGLVTKLASGGIINMPGRGVPIGSAIGGEAGREGVIPLTDSQAMATLGQAIGRYVSINATVPVYVGNRQVARELKKIEAEDDFAFNS